MHLYIHQLSLSTPFSLLFVHKNNYDKCMIVIVCADTSKQKMYFEENTKFEPRDPVQTHTNG